MMNYSNMDLNVKEGVSDKIDGVTVSELVYDGVVLQPSISHQDTAFEFAKGSKFLILPQLFKMNHICEVSLFFGFHLQFIIVATQKKFIDICNIVYNS